MTKAHGPMKCWASKSEIRVFYTASPLSYRLLSTTAHQEAYQHLPILGLKNTTIFESNIYLQSSDFNMSTSRGMLVLLNVRHRFCASNAQTPESFLLFQMLCKYIRSTVSDGCTLRFLLSLTMWVSYQIFSEIFPREK